MDTAVSWSIAIPQHVAKRRKPSFVAVHHSELRQEVPHSGRGPPTFRIVLPRGQVTLRRHMNCLKARMCTDVESWSSDIATVLCRQSASDKEIHHSARETSSGLTRDTGLYLPTASCSIGRQAGKRGCAE